MNTFHFSRLFNFHQYDNLRHSPHKKDPRRRKTQAQTSELSTALFAATNGDIKEIRRYIIELFNYIYKEITIHI